MSTQTQTAPTASSDDGTPNVLKLGLPKGSLQESTFDLLDIQANARIDALNLTVKAGASNVLENLHIETYGGPTVGRLAYLSLLFEVDTRN